MPQRRIEQATSRTAQWTCVSRAASFLERDVHYQSQDQTALLLVPAALGLMLRIVCLRRLLLKAIAPKGIYEYTIARTKYLDAIFKQSLAQGFDQILIFGAGFDTRGLRFQAMAGRTKIFELDVPITQAAKLGQYARRGLSLPANLVFIPIDFDKESLPEKLERSDLATDQRSLFMLEGLLMYLRPESVDATFKVIAGWAGEGSEVVFDYVRASVLRGEGSCYGEEEIARAVAKAGERWFFGLDPSQVGLFLEGHGFRMVEQMDAKSLERRCFTDRSGDPVGCVNGTHCLVRAVKVGGPSPLA